MLSRNNRPFLDNLWNSLLIGILGNCLLSFTKSFKSLIQGKVAKLYTDSKNASIVASKGGTSLRLQRHASLEIFQFCTVNNVWIEFEWVPRSLNEYADSLSRVIDFDDWGVSADFCR